MKRLIFPLLFSFFVLQVSAQENPANLLPLEKRSAHFDSVARHLDLGGAVYAYVDVDGDLSRLVGQVKELLALAQKENSGLRNLPPFLQRLNPEFILDLLGVGNIQAVGLSSYKEGGIFRNKSFVLMKGGPRGLFQIMGGPAHPFATWQMAPVGADLVWEQDLNLKVVYEMVLSILERTMGPPGLEMAEEVMSQKPNEMDFTWKELITQLDTRLIGIVRMDPDQKLRVPAPGRRTVDSLFKEKSDSHHDHDHDHIHAPGHDHESDERIEDEVRRFLEDTDSDEPQPPADFDPGFTVPPPHNVVVPEPRMMEIPLVDFYVSVDNLGWLVDQAVKEFENVQEAEILRANGWQGVGFGKQLPPALEGYQPYLLHEQATGRLVLVSRPEFMNECLANSGGVRQDAHFQQAVQGLPASGNGFTYFSPEIIDVIGGIVADIAEGEDEARAVLPWLLKLLGHLKQPQAVVYRNQDDGVLVSGNQVFSHKGNFFMALITNPVLLGLMYFIGLQSDHAVGEVFQEADRHGAMENLRLLASVYHEYLDVTNGAHIPADTAGVHAWALELADKTGFEDASVFRIDGDIAVDGHRGELAESIRQKSFPGSPFSLSLVAGLPRGAPASTTPLAWTRGLRPSGRWKFDAPFYGDGGLILFLDGSVRFFNSVEDALVDYETKEPTSDISKAVPPTAKILEYDLPELELQLEVPRDLLPKLQIPSNSDGIPLDSLRNPGVLEPAIESVPPGFERFLAPVEVEPEAPKPPE